MITLTFTYIHLVAIVATAISFLLDAFVVGLLWERRKHSMGERRPDEKEV